MNPNIQPMEDPVQEAVARRGLGQQVPQMSQPQQPAPQTSSAPMSAPQVKETFTPKDGHEFLLSTLAESLKNEHKREMEKLKMSAPQQPAQVPQGQVLGADVQNTSIGNYNPLNGPTAQRIGSMIRGIPQALSEIPERYADLVDRINPFRMTMPNSVFDSSLGRHRPLTEEEQQQYRNKAGIINP